MRDPGGVPAAVDALPAKLPKEDMFMIRTLVLTVVLALGFGVFDITTGDSNNQIAPAPTCGPCK